MLPASGTKLLICHRRLFAEDQPRFFVGVVKASEAGLVRVTGYSWTRDPAHGFRRKEDPRTKIVALGSGMILAYELPMEISVEKLRIDQQGGHAVVLTDGAGFCMDLAERLPNSPT